MHLQNFSIKTQQPAHHFIRRCTLLQNKNQLNHIQTGISIGDNNFSAILQFCVCVCVVRWNGTHTHEHVRTSTKPNNKYLQHIHYYWNQIIINNFCSENDVVRWFSSCTHVHTQQRIHIELFVFDICIPCSLWRQILLLLLLLLLPVYDVMLMQAQLLPSCLYPLFAISSE